jgi:hypothetical protein
MGIFSVEGNESEKEYKSLNEIIDIEIEDRPINLINFERSIMKTEVSNLKNQFPCQ